MAPKPETAYALAKLMGEEMARQFCRWDPALKIIGLRFSNVMEPQDYRAFARFDVEPETANGTCGATSTPAMAQPQSGWRWRLRSPGPRCSSSPTLRQLSPDPTANWWRSSFLECRTEKEQIPTKRCSPSPRLAGCSATSPGTVGAGRAKAVAAPYRPSEPLPQRRLSSGPLTGRWVNISRDGSRNPSDRPPGKYQKERVNVVGLGSSDDREDDCQDNAYSDAIDPVIPVAQGHNSCPRVGRQCQIPSRPGYQCRRTPPRIGSSVWLARWGLRAPSASHMTKALTSLNPSWMARARCVRWRCSGVDHLLLE